MQNSLRTIYTRLKLATKNLKSLRRFIVGTTNYTKKDLKDSRSIFVGLVEGVNYILSDVAEDIQVKIVRVNKKFFLKIVFNHIEEDSYMSLEFDVSHLRVDNSTPAIEQSIKLAYKPRKKYITLPITYVLS